MSMRGWFDFARENNNPAIFEKERAQVAYDSQLLAIGATFATIYVAFLIVLLGIRKARLKTFITVTMLVGVGFSILASLYGDGWHVSNARILAQYRSFRTQQLSQQIHVNIGLNSMNITLQSLGGRVNAHKHGDVNFDRIDDNERRRRRREVGTLTARTQTQPDDDSENGTSLLLASHPLIPATAKTFTINYAADDQTHRSKLDQPIALARERRLLSLQQNRNDIAIASTNDQQIDSSEPLDSNSQSLFQPESPASYFMFPNEQQIMLPTTEAPKPKNFTQLSLSDIGSGGAEEALAFATAKFSSSSDAVSSSDALARARHAPENQMSHAQQYFYYNERFAWWAVDDVSRAYSLALRKGLPYPILTVVEYMCMAGGGFSWGHYYRSAGYYTSGLLWAAFGSWLASILLFCIVSRYGAYMCACTGMLMLLVNILYAICVPSTPLVVKFEEGTLTFSMGWCFFLVLATGLVSVSFAALVATMEFFSPHWFSTVLELDYDTPFSYRPINKRMSVAARSVSLLQRSSSVLHETYEESPQQRKSYFSNLPQIIRSRIDERRNRDESTEKQKQKQAARLRTAKSQPALTSIREVDTPSTSTVDREIGVDNVNLVEQRRNSASEPIISSTRSSGVFMTAISADAQPIEDGSMLDLHADSSNTINTTPDTAVTSAAGSSRASMVYTEEIVYATPASNEEAKSAESSGKEAHEPSSSSTAAPPTERGPKSGGLRMRQSSSTAALNPRRRISFAHLQFGPNPPPSSSMTELRTKLEALGDDKTTSSRQTGNVTPSPASVTWKNSTPPYAADEMAMTNIPVQWQPMVVDEDSGMEHYKEWERIMHEQAMQRREAQQRAQERRSNSVIVVKQSVVRPAADHVRFAPSNLASSTQQRPIFTSGEESLSNSSKWAGLRSATKFAFSKRSHSVAPQASAAVVADSSAKV